MQLPQRFINEGSVRPMAMFACAHGIHDPAPLSLQPFARDMLLGDRIIDEQWRTDIELLPRMLSSARSAASRCHCLQHGVR